VNTVLKLAKKIKYQKQHWYRRLLNRTVSTAPTYSNHEAAIFGENTLLNKSELSSNTPHGAPSPPNLKTP